ncbi:MAG: DUF2934 domain-containing protein [Chloroflexi bacterium]|nr:DUF2934 domain-containing protein [Chloroflexota bacterium]
MKTPPRSTSSDTIPARAYQLWETAGRPTGRDQEFWLLAEHELKAKFKAPGSIAPAGKGTPRSPAVREGRVTR